MGAELVGKVIDGRYRILSPLGAGGVGAVYRAEQPGGGPTVALKMLHDEYGTDPESRERFQREARALNGLQHPNIVGVVDFGLTDTGPYLVMELLEGMPLDAFLEKEQPAPEVALDLVRQTLTGLAFAHAQGVIHRDMKPENVFVARLPGGRLQAKILDFGLAKFVDDARWGPAQKLTVMGAVMGTPAYMSPEQGTGQRLDARSDVYSTGVVLFEALTGTWPFLGEERTDMLRMHLMDPVPALGASKPGLGARPELQALIEKAMGKLPEHRFKDAGEMLAALDAIPKPAVWFGPAPRQTASPAPIPQSQTPTYVPPEPVPALAQTKGTPTWVWIALAVGLVSILGIAAIAAVFFFLAA